MQLQRLGVRYGLALSGMGQAWHRMLKGTLPCDAIYNSCTKYLSSATRIWALAAA